jgi:hypothetical protein
LAASPLGQGLAGIEDRLAALANAINPTPEGI